MAGDLRLRLQPTPNGIRLEGLVDAAMNRNLLAGPSLPLFSISARLEGKAEPVILTAEQGWSEVEIAGGGPVESATSTQQYQLSWLRPVDRRFGNLRVTGRVDAEPPTSIFRWTLKIDQIPAACSLWRVIFPQVAIADLGPSGSVFVPKAAGEVERRSVATSLPIRGHVSQQLVFDADHGRLRREPANWTVTGHP